MQWLDDLWTNNRESILAMAKALGILLGGWLVAWVVSMVVRGLLRKTDVDDRIVRGLVGEERVRKMDVEKTIGTGLFWFLMLFVLLAFFDALDLPTVAGPISALLNSVMGFLPKIAGAAVLLFVAWLIASGLRKLVVAALDRTSVDERLQQSAGDTTKAPLSRTIGETVYWLVFLLFLPLVLGTLQLDGLLGPVQTMLDELLGFLPNLLAAAVVFAVGWFVAKILRRVVTNVLAATGVDKLGQKAGLKSGPGKQTLSGLCGLVVFVMVLVPVIVQSLESLKIEAVAEPAKHMLEKVTGTFPQLFAAGLILVVSVLVGKLVGGLVANLLAGAGFDRLFVKLGVAKEEAAGERTPSKVTGTLLLVGVVLFASMEASNVLGFGALGELIRSFLVQVGKILMGLVILGIGLYLANLARGAIAGSQRPQAKFLSRVAWLAIVVLATSMGLRQMELANEIIELGFALTLGAIAVAAAIAFGLGGRDIAAGQLREWVQGTKGKP